MQGKCILCGKSTRRNQNTARPCCNRCEKTAPVALTAPVLFARGVAGQVAQAAMEASAASAERSHNERVLNGLKAIYARRRSPWHGTPTSWTLSPNGIDAEVTEQYGLSTQTIGFSFRDSRTGLWKAGGESIKIFGERYTLDGQPLQRSRESSFNR